MSTTEKLLSLNQKALKLLQQQKTNWMISYITKNSFSCSSFGFPLFIHKSFPFCAIIGGYTNNKHDAFSVIDRKTCRKINLFSYIALILEDEIVFKRIMYDLNADTITNFSGVPKKNGFYNLNGIVCDVYGNSVTTRRLYDIFGRLGNYDKTIEYRILKTCDALLEEYRS